MQKRCEVLPTALFRSEGKPPIQLIYLILRFDHVSFRGDTLNNIFPVLSSTSLMNLTFIRKWESEYLPGIWYIQLVWTHKLRYGSWIFQGRWFDIDDEDEDGENEFVYQFGAFRNTRSNRTRERNIFNWRQFLYTYHSLKSFFFGVLGSFWSPNEGDLVVPGVGPKWVWDAPELSRGGVPDTRANWKFLLPSSIL